MKRILKYFSLFILVIALGIATLMAWASSKTTEAISVPRTFKAIELPPVEKRDVALGERIVTVRNGCVDCHGSDLGGAKVIDDPAMGLVWGSNLTPARLGKWSDEEIAQAIRNGVSREHRNLILMPSHEYQHLSREDLASVVAYLRSIPAVEREVPAITLSPLAKVLFTLGKLPTLIPAYSIIKANATFVEKPAELPTTEFGKYLVTSSCTGCHGPRLEGGPIPGAPPSWAPASSLRGLAQRDWKFETFVQAMRQGLNPAGQKLKAPMPVALTSKMTDTELQALWNYLATVQ